MRHLFLPLLLLVGAATTRSVTAWHAAHASNSSTSSSSTSRSTEAPSLDELTGVEPVRISVGCGAWTTYPTEDAIDPTRPRFTYVVENPVAEFITLHFKRFHLPPNDYVVVRPTGSGETQSLRYVGRNSEPPFFTRALYTKSVTLELFTNNTATDAAASTSNATAPCAGFEVDEYRFLAAPASIDDAEPEAVCSKDESAEATCFQSFPDAYKQSNAVARLLIHKNKKSFFCTGWLVGCEGHVMTNHHCISEALHAENAEFEFLAQGNACNVNCAKGFACRGKTRATSATLLVANEALDYALLKVNGNLSKDYGFLQMRAGGAIMRERIYIPQHPSGWGKRIAMKDGEDWGKVLSLTRGGCLPNQVAYNLDTRGGSSGAPVIAWKDHAVVALHHCGGCPNTAVNIDKIIQDLRKRELLPKCAVYEPLDAPHGGASDDYTA